VAKFKRKRTAAIIMAENRGKKKRGEKHIPEVQAPAFFTPMCDMPVPRGARRGDTSLPERRKHMKGQLRTEKEKTRLVKIKQSSEGQASLTKRDKVQKEKNCCNHHRRRERGGKKQEKRNEPSLKTLQLNQVTRERNQDSLKRKEPI